MHGQQICALATFVLTRIIKRQNKIQIFCLLFGADDGKDNDGGGGDDGKAPHIGHGHKQDPFSPQITSSVLAVLLIVCMCNK